jgi:hypothetical protein
MSIDSQLVPVARHREHAYAIALHAASELLVEFPELCTALLVGALADDGVMVELALRCEPEDAADAVVALLQVNHRAHDFIAWGYFVVSLVPDAWVAEGASDLLAALPSVADLDMVDAAASDAGVEILDWLVVAGTRGVSLFEALGRGWRWIDREDSPSSGGPRQ